MENIKNMTPKLMGETWRKYPTETSKQKVTYGLFECQYCGKEFEATVKNVKCGATKSCGCLKGEGHGLRGHKLYGTWGQMVQRCTNPKHKAYKDYGGRGITICEEWLDIKNFIAWAESTHPNEGGYTLDRMDNDKGYSPENCRWADKTMQSVNQRIQKSNTTGYVGVYLARDNRWESRLTFNKVDIFLGRFNTIEEAVQARDNYIIENNLPHKLSTEYY